MFFVRFYIIFGLAIPSEMLKIARQPLFPPWVKVHKTMTITCLESFALNRERTTVHVTEEPQQQADESRTDSSLSNTLSFFTVRVGPGGLVHRKMTAQKTALSRKLGPLLLTDARGFFPEMTGFLGRATGSGKSWGPEMTRRLSACLKKRVLASGQGVVYAEVVRQRSTVFIQPQ